MGQKIVIGPITKGYTTDVLPFNIDNDAFPQLINAYQWRGRVRRKRGTSLLGRLTRAVLSTSTTDVTLVLPSTNVVNIFALLGLNVSQPDASVVPGTLANPIVIVIGAQTLTDSTGTGTFVVTAGNITAASINYGTGNITISFTAGAGPLASSVTSMKYHPNLPVLGLEPFVQDATDNVKQLGFDTTYAYNITLTQPSDIYSVSYYINPSSPNSNYPSYTQKVTPLTAVKWNLQDYQQIWTTNYQGALWSTPGIRDPFVKTGIGMQYKPITGFVRTAAGPPATATITIAGHGLSIGDFLFLNEIGGVSGANLQTCYVIAPAIDANNVNVEFPIGTLGAGAYSANTGIAQYLTNNSDPSVDCIRWYNGEPISSSGAFQTNAGWVNFCPPLVTANFGQFSIADLPPGIYYLVGARMIVPYKDRLLFFGPVVQTSVANSQVYLPDTVIYSQNGTPYYTTSFASTEVDPSISSLVAATFRPVLLPDNQTAQPQAFFENAVGFGGFITAGYARPIVTVSPNEDALIVGFSDRQARLLYTGNDSTPFTFFIINSELGSDATFSSITLDRGVISVGGRGIILTNQVSAERLDLSILDQLFQFKLINGGSRRICAQRDFINEWIYFTYASSQNNYRYPTQTLQYNYREGTWGLFNEAYTTYGTMRFKEGYTWSTIGKKFPRWGSWNEPWKAGSSNLLQPKVVAGNQQGFVIVREDGTNEAESLYIRSVSGNTVTSPDHCLINGDYIVISGVIGTIASQLNGKIFSVSLASQDTFVLNPAIGSGTYIGGGLIKKMYVPFIQTKQFPVAWQMARKTRIGTQMYLFQTTASGSVTALIFLSQNSASAYNTGPIVPSANSINTSLVYSNVVPTSPERYAQKVTNASLGSIGDGVSVTYSMNYVSLFGVGDLVPGTISITVGTVATFSDNGDGTLTGTGTGTTGTVGYDSGIVVLNFSVAPLNQLSSTTFDYYYPDIQSPTAGQQSQIWHRMNTSLIGDTVQLGITLSDEQMRDTRFRNQFVEIELHSVIIDVSPSQDLA
jgi:hypothetical protein